MGIPLGSNFDLSTAIPLDSRTVVADLTARDALGAGVRFIGLHVYVVSEDMTYKLVGGILDANWEEAGGGGSSGFGEFSDDTQAGTITIPTPTTRFIRLYGDGISPVIVEGIGAAVDINEITIFNYSNYPLTFLDSGAIDPDTWIWMPPPGNNLEMRDFTHATFAYDPLTSVWLLTSKSDNSVVNREDLEIGTGSGDVSIIARTGAAPTVSPPTIKYDDTLGKWTFSHDGITFAPFGAGELSFLEVVGDYTLIDQDVLFVDCTAGNVIISLPTAVGYKKPVRIKKMDTTDYYVAIAPDGSETIDGESSYVIYDGKHSITLITDNANWSTF